MDREKMRRGVELFLQGIGQRFPGDDLEATPERVARAWADDLAGGYASDPVRELTWSQAPADSGLVLLREVRFASVCVHHLLPFFGTAHLAYLPAERLAGLSKLGRVVDIHARRLQIQERLTSDVLATIVEALRPKGALVFMEAEHTCMTLRGARKEGSRLTTLAAAGALETEPMRGEVLRLLAADRDGVSSAG
jgi:GTP cyclohydrolase I